jgi:iron complex outermembrane receptor protein
MRLSAILLAGTALSLGSPAFAAAQEAPAPAAPTEPDQPHPEQTSPPAPGTAPDTAQEQDIVVTARKREESLKDVPVAATAITGETIEKRGLVAVKDVAMLTPGLSINSDGAGRAFVSIRGVGVTLVDSVQPGVGIFLDGIYQPNTSYLNNPLNDVERVEVLRGPQGTLYGKNTLGGAINVITRQPTNSFEGKVIGSYAGPDHAWTVAGSVSGPIVRDRLQARIGYSHQQQDGFIHNIVTGKPGNPYNTDNLSATIRAEPVDDLIFTVNGYYNWVKGGSVPYAFVSGPTDYERDIQVNATNYNYFKYRGINAKVEAPLGDAHKLTLIGAYDNRDTDAPDSDEDFTPIDLLRTAGHDDLKTRTLEARLDSELSPTLSSIFGLFYSRETRDTDKVLTFFPGLFNFVNTQTASRVSDTYAVFGNIFWRPNDTWEVSAGLRWDEQRQKLTGEAVSVFPAPSMVLTDLKLNEKNLSPRVAVTYHANREWMAYASVARGSRGGGFNPPVVKDTNLLTYTGDNVWTFEVGTKYSSSDRRLSLAASVFYNDYKNYIGLNTIAPSTTGSFTTIDLNTGDAKSYGIELEGQFRPVPQWTLSGAFSYQHARLTNFDAYTEATANPPLTPGRVLASKRLTFQPDWNFALNSDYVIPLGNGDLTFNLGATGKGSRIAASLSETVAPVLKEYVLVNSSLTYSINNIEIGAFVTNLLNEDYMESYIEKTTLILANLPPTDIGIPGDKRRYGIRTRIRF